MATISTPVGDGSEAVRSDLRGGILLLGLLTLAVVFSFLDRVILGLLIKPIRADLGLTDTQFSMLFGLIFAGPYVLASLFAGRLADRFRRLSLLRWAIMLWSVATLLSMLATGFWHLAAARILVAVGEAALLPCSYSLLADRFPRGHLGRAYSVLIMGATVGTGIALVFGSVLYDAIAVVPLYHVPFVGDVRPWQMTFLVVGLPGIVLALVIGMLPEPQRNEGGAPGDALSLRAALQGFAKQWKAYVPLVLGFALSAMSLQTVQIFGVQHFVRTYGMTLTEAGFRVGLPVVLLGPCGLWLGGWLNDYWRAKGHGDAAFLVGVLAATGLASGTALAMLAPASGMAQAALMLVGFFSNFPFGAAASGMVTITPQRARGTITAFYTLFATLFGAGLSPVITALVADHLFASELLVGRAVAIVSAVSSIVAIGLFLFGRPHLRRALAEAG